MVIYELNRQAFATQHQDENRIDRNLGQNQ